MGLFETLTGIVAIVLIFGTPLIIVAIIAFHNSRQKQRIHDERMKAIELGQELPDWNNSKLPPYVGFRTAGLIISFLGLGIIISVIATAGWDLALASSIPLFLGLGLLAVAYYNKKSYEKMTEEDKDNQ